MGLSATSICMVVQLGFDIIPLLLPSASEFTSGTTSGTFSSIRHVLELSITLQPSNTAMGANFKLASSPAENNAMSIFSKAPTFASFTVNVFPSNIISLETFSKTSKAVSSFIGKDRLSNIFIIC